MEERLHQLEGCVRSGMPWTSARPSGSSGPARCTWAIGCEGWRRRRTGSRDDKACSRRRWARAARCQSSKAGGIRTQRRPIRFMSGWRWRKRHTTMWASGNGSASGTRTARGGRKVRRWTTRSSGSSRRRATRCARSPRSYPRDIIVASRRGGGVCTTDSLIPARMRTTLSHMRQPQLQVQTGVSVVLHALAPETRPRGTSLHHS
jgi:hypothetical protein